MLRFSKLFTAVTLILFAVACDEETPEKEDVPELITKATFTFTPDGDGDPIIVTATDPDGDGVQPVTVDGEINLAQGATYVLTITLNNTLAKPGDPAYDITKEVEEEGDEHMFFFGWTGNVFADPTGNGNIDSRADKVNYTGGSNSLDEDGLPLGLTTTWTTSDAVSEGKLEVRLKHQPDLKSETSGSDVGETDLALEFQVNIVP